MADTPESKLPTEETTETADENSSAVLVPDFAHEGESSQTWTPLTTVNTDYERLWSVPNGASHTLDPEPESPPPLPDTPEPPTPSAATPGFAGTLVTGSEVLNASIIVGSAGIVLWGGGAEIGTWEHSEAKIARLTHSRFAIQAEGETLTFTAEDPTGLDNAITAAVPAEVAAESAAEVVAPAAPAEAPAESAAEVTAPAESAPVPVSTPVEVEPPPATPISPPAEAPQPSFGTAPVRRPRIKNFRPEPSDESPHPAPLTEPALSPTSPEADTDEDAFTIADSVRQSSDRKTVKAHRFQLAGLRSVAIKVGVILGLILVLAGAAYAVMLLTGQVGEREATATSQPSVTAPPATIVITTAPPATTPTTPPLPDTTFFQTDPAVLTERWNSLAEVSAPNMVLFSDLTSPFILLLTPNVTLEGVIDPVAGNVTMRATPTGTPEGDGAILSALGILIGTADPTLAGPDRKALLAQLGLDVDDPQLGGINGTLTHNGLVYRMVYQAEQNTLEFAFAPEGSVTTTAAG